MSEKDKIQRSALPIPDQPYMGLITYDAKDPDSKFPPIDQLRPPKGAPNVLIILIDDAGFGSSSAFGGPCHTPVAEQLAANGLKFNRFHTTALCSPARRAIPRYGPTPWRRWRRRSSSTGIPPRSSASATRCPCGRRAPPAPST